MFKDRVLGKLDDKWTKFREKVTETQETTGYSKLMVETFPVLYKAWNESKDVVSKDVAALVATMSQLFQSFDEDWNEYVDDELVSMFHRDFLQAFIYDRKELLNDDGMIEFEVDEMNHWIVDSKTFEITDDNLIDM